MGLGLVGARRGLVGWRGFRSGGGDRRQYTIKQSMIYFKILNLFGLKVTISFMLGMQVPQQLPPLKNETQESTIKRVKKKKTFLFIQYKNKSNHYFQKSGFSLFFSFSQVSKTQQQMKIRKKVERQREGEEREMLAAILARCNGKRVSGYPRANKMESP